MARYGQTAEILRRLFGSRLSGSLTVSGVEVPLTVLKDKPRTDGGELTASEAFAQGRNERAAIA